MLKSISNLRNRYLTIIDLFFFLITPTIALFLRLDSIPAVRSYTEALIIYTVIFTFIKLVVNYKFGLYRRVWKHASLEELEVIIIAVITIGISEFIIYRLIRYFLPVQVLPRSITFIDIILTLLFISFSRLLIRFSAHRYARSYNHNGKSQRTLIIGAGDAGVSLASDMAKHRDFGYEPVGFIDDDPRKVGLNIRGLEILGTSNELQEIIDKANVNQAIIAIPSASGEEIRTLVNKCMESGIKIKTLPGLSEILDNEINIRKIRDININDLLRRDPVEIDSAKIGSYLQGKRVLISGAGGSIGSEICRQIFHFTPSELILLGHGENSIFKIEQELLGIENKQVNISAKIGDIRDLSRLDSIFEKFQPEIVFHAAAHKHVPLMENNPCEAVRNNIIGTRNMLTCAKKFKAEKFIMISTDKAVNPTSVMGVTKRIAETIVIKQAKENNLPFLCVRFGNVLGSNGSVVPTFQAQITRGGPVTVTHPEVKRYFMSIPEAVQLVLQAASIGKGGEVFVLNMGEPVKIVDLAKDMIRLSGYRDHEIAIKFTGLRPGDKLFEELFIDGENYITTKLDKIYIAPNAGDCIPTNFDRSLSDLTTDLNKKDPQFIRDKLHEIIGEYQPGGSCENGS